MSMFAKPSCSQDGTQLQILGREGGNGDPVAEPFWFNYPYWDPVTKLFLVQLSLPDWDPAAKNCLPGCMALESTAPGGTDACY